MKHVEKFIRHLQSSIEKRKRFISMDVNLLEKSKDNATLAYNKNDKFAYERSMEFVEYVKGRLKELHKQQKTETEMLKWLENIRSCHEEMICAMYGDDTNLLDFSLEEEQHD